LERMKNAGTTKTSSLTDSKLFNEKDLVQTDIPIINTAFSGSLDGGIVSGITVAAGPSKHFKSLLGLMCVAAYLKKYEDSVCLFYDSEFGISKEYLEANGIDGNRVLHIPILNIEELKFDMVKRLEEIKRGDKVFIFIDSMGNLASKKEIEDATEEKSVADMSRAKMSKSFFRIVTPHFTMKDIPCFIVGHTYDTQEMYSKKVVSGGTGMYYSAQTIFIVGRSQEKDGTEVTGWNFILNIEKSRFVKEKSKLTFHVSYENGINKWSGLLDLALESGHATKPKNGWYTRPAIDIEKNYREKDTNTEEFWAPILADDTFKEFVRNKFMLSSKHEMNESLAEGED
jgi:RecA/RadA recombinase